MKKLLMMLVALMMLVSVAACSNNTNNETPTPSDEPDVQDVVLNDGTYDGYDPQPTYLARALVTIEGGKAVSYEYEEIHLPNYWATYTEAEAAEAGEAEVMAVEGARGTSYYARHAVVGTGDEAIHLVALDEPKEAPNGSTYTAYGNDEIPNFSDWVKDDENAAWYYEQIFAGNYWIEDAEGNLKEDLAVYSTTRKDGVVLNKVESRMKTKIQHWTAVGTGVGTEMGENGWTGNLEILGNTLIELQFPEGEVTKNEENKVVIADTVTSATVEEYKGYVQMFYDAYNKAK
ncbi:MAG: hypothetical protein J6K75_04285 [Erysipelotrichaceae bacterium]|nr:hypothetical protein [Erysipelotrichaceae bacterium]